MPVPIVPLLAGGYAIVSGTLLVFPQLLHRRLAGRKMRHGSHRGGAGEATENTLPAFRNAVRCGSELLELDVHLGLSSPCQLDFLTQAAIKTTRPGGYDRKAWRCSRGDIGESGSLLFH